MSELRGVVYMIKRRGREHAKTDVQRREITFTFNTKRKRGQITLKTVKDSASYHKERRSNEMLWSIVSNAAEI